MARTFQQTTLFGELTALDNVLQGLHRHVAPRAVGGPPGRRRSYRDEERRLASGRSAILSVLGIGAHADEVAADLPLGIQKLLTVAVALATEPRAAPAGRAGGRALPRGGHAA